ncbi:MAG: hypothetical protein IPI63_00665 [Methanothrix sp.]|jgi:hypothetical protein|uniref:hypothetical protein n=1 Tax=Methanothrix sp. TaxID=90426 RepID=UPI001BD2F2B7|nr:hypothetical protein [Methanothrix sp.]MBK7385298.1 hypothetical protein [Methanothrix sp.]HPW73581.1 hypothetical protein [Methanothrix sp.]
MLASPPRLDETLSGSNARILFPRPMLNDRSSAGQTPDLGCSGLLQLLGLEVHPSHSDPNQAVLEDSMAYVTT